MSISEPDAIEFDMVVSGSATQHYEGDTEVTPTEAEQVLSTTGLVVDDDITVHAIDSEYVGSDIPRQDSLVTAWPNVTASAGYYAEDATATVDGGSVTMPSPIIESTPTITVDASGSITASVNASTTVTPSVIPGWVTSAESGMVTATGTATEHLDTVPGNTITPTTSVQTAVPSGKFTVGDVKVAAMPSGTAGTPVATKSAVSNHSVTVTPSVVNNTGYITGGTKTGAAVSVSASELVSGSQTVTSNQTVDATNLAEVVVAVPGASLQSKTKTYTPTTSVQSESISADAGYDGLSGVSVTVDAMPAGNKGGSATTSVTQDSSYKYYTTNWTNATNGYYAASAFNPAATVRFTRQNETVTPDTTTQTVTPQASYYYLDKVTVNPIPPEYIIPSGTYSITANGTGIDISSYAAVDVSVSGGPPNLQNKTKSYTPTETAQSETVSADAGYDGLGTVDVSVGAISSSYVGSGVTRRDSSDLSASGATVTVPAGYYTNAASKAVSSGSATPAATISGTSANVSIGTNAITLTKTVSNTPQVSAGYISAGTAGNSSVSLTGTVPTQGAQTFHPSTTNQSVSGSRYLTGAQTFNAVTTTNLVAGNIKDGVTIQIGDSSDSDCVASVTGTYTGGGGSSKNVQIAQGVNRVSTTTYTEVSGQALTVAKTGTYHVYWSGYRSSTSGTNGSQLYINDSAYGSAQTTFSNNGQSVHLSNVSLTQGQDIAVRARARGTSYYMYVANLTIIEA